MSRIGKKPISVPQGVKVALDGATVRAEGPKGKLSQAIPSGVSVTMESNVLTAVLDDALAVRLIAVGVPPPPPPAPAPPP